MMREFHRMAQLDGVLNNILDETSGPDVSPALRLEHTFIELLLSTGEDREAIGTIRDAAAHGLERTFSRVLPGTVAQQSQRIETDFITMALLNYYNRDHPRVYLPLMQRSTNTEPLSSFIRTYNYALLDGRRVTPTIRSKRGSAGSSHSDILAEPQQPRCGTRALALSWRDTGDVCHRKKHLWKGITSPGTICETFLLFFITPPGPDSEMTFLSSPELGVETWLYKEYARPGDVDYPPCVMPLAQIQFQFPSSLAAFGLEKRWERKNSRGPDEVASVIQRFRESTTI
ncbi:hypothetical protein B0H14DRAFT_3570497 [Mycena olivaceomarginata]|nr:hypothetical protein B0H14DRAFT_3570497 [Mycena olivaceomarginata]